MGAAACKCGHLETRHQQGQCSGEVVRFRPLRVEPCPCTKFHQAKEQA